MTIDSNPKKSRKPAAIDLSGPEGKLCIAAVLGAFYTTAWIALEPEPPVTTAAPALEAPKSAPVVARAPAKRRVRIRTRSS